MTTADIFCWVLVGIALVAAIVGIAIGFSVDPPKGRRSSDDFDKEDEVKVNDIG